MSSVHSLYVQWSMQCLHTCLSRQVPYGEGRGICDLPSCIRTAGVRLMTLFGSNRRRPPVSSRLWDLIDSSLNKQHWYVSHAVFHSKQRCRRERTRNWVKERERNREEKSHWSRFRHHDMTDGLHTCTLDTTSIFKLKPPLASVRVFDIVLRSISC